MTMIKTELQATCVTSSCGLATRHRGDRRSFRERETIPELVLTVGPNTDLDIDSEGAGAENPEAYLSHFFFHFFQGKTQ